MKDTLARIAGGTEKGIYLVIKIYGTATFQDLIDCGFKEGMIIKSVRKLEKWGFVLRVGRGVYRDVIGNGLPVDSEFKFHVQSKRIPVDSEFRFQVLWKRYFFFFCWLSRLLLDVSQFSLSFPASLGTRPSVSILLLFRNFRSLNPFLKIVMISYCVRPSLLATKFRFLSIFRAS